MKAQGGVVGDCTTRCRHAVPTFMPAETLAKRTARAAPGTAEAVISQFSTPCSGVLSKIRCVSPGAEATRRRKLKKGKAVGSGSILGQDEDVVRQLFPPN